MIVDILVFFITSIILSSVGIGGGIFYVPIFLFLGYSFPQASTTSLFLITVTGFSAFTRFRKEKMVDWQLALVMETFTDLGAFIGGAVSIKFHPLVLKVILGIILLIAAYFMIKPRVNKLSSAKITTSFGLWHRHFAGYDYYVSLPVVIPVTFIIGLLAGMLGIAGGIFKIPIMILWFDIPAKIAVATSSLMVSLTGLLGLTGHLLHTRIDWQFAIILGFTVFIGGQIGSRISIKLSENRVKLVLSIITAIIGVYMILATIL